MSESIYEFLWYVNNVMLALLQGGFLWYNLTPKFNKHLVFLITTIPFTFLVLSQKFVDFVAPSFLVLLPLAYYFCLRDSALQRKIQNESVCGDNHFRTGVVHHRSSRSDIECIGHRQQHPGSKSYTNTVSARLHNNFHCVYIFQKAQARGRFNKTGFDARVHYIPAESNAAARHMSYITEPLRLGNRKQPALIVQRP